MTTERSVLTRERKIEKDRGPTERCCGSSVIWLVRCQYQWDFLFCLFVIYSPSCVRETKLSIFFLTKTLNISQVFQTFIRLPLKEQNKISLGNKDIYFFLTKTLNIIFEGAQMKPYKSLKQLLIQPSFTFFFVI